jgi:hypothetical protein
MNHNVNHLTLLRNKDFTIAREKKKSIKFRVPTLDAYIVDSNLTLLLNLMQINLEDFKSENELAFVNHYDLLLYLCFNGELQDRLVDVLEEYIIDIRIQTNGLFIDVDKITEEELNFIIISFRVALGLESLDQIGKASQTIEDEYEQKAREAEEKIQRIKKKGAKEQSPETGFEMDAVMLGVIKEFGFTMEQVLSMNIYTLLWFYQYVWKIGAYNIETIAYGNGLLKKHKHYLD